MVYDSGCRRKCTLQFSFFAFAKKFMGSGVMIMNWSRMEGKNAFQNMRIAN
jgi:hypothetical protein